MANINPIKARLVALSFKESTSGLTFSEKEEKRRLEEELAEFSKKMSKGDKDESSD